MTLLRCHFKKLTHHPENSGKHLMLEAFRSETELERERKVRKKRLREIEREGNKMHEIGEKDRRSEIDGDLREGKRKNRERNLERGSVVSRERRNTAEYEMTLKKKRIKILREKSEREMKCRK